MPTKSNILIGPMVADQQATYHAALDLVARIDADQKRGIRHYRNRRGELLQTLDQVIEAILSNDWPVLEPAERQLAP